MQIMPLADPLLATLGCMIFLSQAALALTCVVAIILRIFLGKKAASFARVVGALAFLFGFAGSLVYSSGAYYSSDAIFITTWGALAALGLTAWLLGLHTATRREIIIGSIVAPLCALVAAFAIWRDADYRDRRDALFSAALRGDHTTVKRLMATGLSPDLEDNVHTRLLEKAADARTTTVILEAGADVRGAPRAVVTAAERGNLLTLKLLLARGGDPNARRGRYSAAKLAWWNGHEATLEALRQAGSSEAGSLQRLTGLLFSAVQAGDAEAVRRALKNEYLDRERELGLQLAAAKGDGDIAMTLVSKTDAYREVAVAALTAANHRHWELFEKLLAALEHRQAGFIVRETKAAALSMNAPEINRIAAAQEWERQELPKAEDVAWLRNMAK